MEGSSEGALPRRELPDAAYFEGSIFGVLRLVLPFDKLRSHSLRIEQMVGSSEACCLGENSLMLHILKEAFSGSFDSFSPFDKLRVALAQD